MGNAGDAAESGLEVRWVRRELEGVGGLGLTWRGSAGETWAGAGGLTGRPGQRLGGIWGEANCWEEEGSLFCFIIRIEGKGGGNNERERRYLQLFRVRAR